MPRGGVYRNLFLNSPDSIGRLLFPEDFDELSPGEMQFADIMGDIVEQWFMRSKRLEPMTIPAALNMLLDDSLSEDFDMPPVPNRPEMGQRSRQGIHMRQDPVAQLAEQLFRARACSVSTLGNAIRSGIERTSA